MMVPTTDQPHNGPLRKQTYMTSAKGDGGTLETDTAEAGCMILDMTENLDFLEMLFADGPPSESGWR